MDVHPDNNTSYLTAELSDHDFNRISRFVGENYGINLPLSKKIMVQSRLKKILRMLNMPTFNDYCQYIFKEDGNKEKIVQLIDAISTNKSDFFRESVHFDFLADTLLPDYLNQHPNRTIHLFSAGCSSGEEVYTLAMVMSELIQSRNTDNLFQIVGADISSIILEKARQAVYPFSKSKEIPNHFLTKYVLKSKNRDKPTIRIAPELRRRTSFIRMNLMDAEYGIDDHFQIIFCRNTLIYFKKKNQEAIIRKLFTHLKPGGFFFVGHSESLIHMDIPCHQIKPTIYQKL